MPRLEALYREWRRNPPLVLMVKSFFGIKDEPDSLPSGKPGPLPDFATLPDFEE